MTAWMIIALLGLSVSFPMFLNEDSDDNEDGLPETPQTPETPTPLNQIIDGTDGNDQLEATSGQTLNGLAGDDTLTSAEGAEGVALNGGTGADEIELFGANGTADGGEGQDTIIFQARSGGADVSTSVVTGGDGDDTITAFGVGGTVLGGDGDDVIDVQGRLDGVFGGAGNDIIASDSLDSAGGSPIDGGTGDDVIALTHSPGFNYQSLVNGGAGNDTISTQSVLANDGTVDVFDILTGGTGADVFEMSFVGSNPDSSAGATLGTIVEITDFNAEEDQLIVDLSAFPVLATQIDATNQISFEIVERADGSGSDVVFTAANADANGPVTGTIALTGVTGLATDDINLVFNTESEASTAPSFNISTDGSTPAPLGFSLFGDGGTNVANGTDGDDVITQTANGTAETYELNAGAGDDTISVTGGITVDSGIGADTIIFTPEPDVAGGTEIALSGVVGDSFVINLSGPLPDGVTNPVEINHTRAGNGFEITGTTIQVLDQATIVVSDGDPRGIGMPGLQTITVNYQGGSYVLDWAARSAEIAEQRGLS